VLLKHGDGVSVPVAAAAIAGAWGAELPRIAGKGLCVRSRQDRCLDETRGAPCAQAVDNVDWQAVILAVEFDEPGFHLRVTVVGQVVKFESNFEFELSCAIPNSNFKLWREIQIAVSNFCGENKPQCGCVLIAVSTWDCVMLFMFARCT
jgi:hypothetical protein